MKLLTTRGRRVYSKTSSDVGDCLLGLSRVYLKQIDRVGESVQSTIITKGEEISKVVGAEDSPLFGVLAYIGQATADAVSTDIRDVHSKSCQLSPTVPS